MNKSHHNKINFYVELCPACSASLFGVGLMATSLEATDFGIFCMASGVGVGIICGTARAFQSRSAAAAKRSVR